MHKRAVIVNAYSYHNAGDAAIMISTTQLLNDLGFSWVGLSTRYAEDVDAYRKWDVEVVPPLVRFSARQSDARFKRMAGFALDALLTVLALSFPKRILHHSGGQRVLAAIRPGLRPVLHGNVPVIAGGGYLYSSKRRLNFSLWHSLLTIWVCRRLSEQVLIMPASVGPIHRRLDRWLLEYVCGSAGMVLREEGSLEKSSRRPRLANLRTCPDVAFYGGDTVVAERDGRPTRIVRIVLMDWQWSKSVDSSKMPTYIQGMAEVVRGLVGKGYDVELGGHSTLTEHGQDDLLICDKVAEASGVRVWIDRNADVAHLWSRYREVDLVLGTRLHACIMAVSVSTPCVVLAYQEKGEGVMAVAGVPADVFRVDNFVPHDVVSACEMAITETRRLEVVAANSHARRQIAKVYSEN